MLTSKKKAEFLKPVEGQLQKKDDLPNLVLHLRTKVRERERERGLSDYYSVIF